MPVPTNPSLPEPAGIWLRVSTGAQDEQNQEPEIMAWCAQHGYEVVKRYELSGKSAFHGKQQDALDEALTDARTGRIRVLVAWAADRLERRGAEQTLRTFRLFREAGGRIESVKEPFLNTPGELLELLLPIVAWVARFEAQRRQDRAKADRAKARSAGSFTGRPPWGLEPVKLDGRWTLVPGPDGRKYVPEMFARVIRGETLRAIAAWLTAETGRAWWPQVVRGMVTNPVYMGRQTDNAGVVIVECEALVDAATFARAGEALATRPKRGPAHRTMLGGVIFCPRCEDSPMYRVLSGKPGRRTGYYRCWGRGPERGRGCGNAVRCDLADAAVCRIAETTFRRQHVVTRTLVAGSTHEKELAGVAFELKQLGAAFAAEKVTDEEHQERFAALVAERKRLKALPAVPDRWEEAEQDETFADLWAAVEPAERGGWLKRQGFRVEADREAVRLSRPGYLVPRSLAQPGRGRVIPAGWTVRLREPAGLEAAAA